MQLAHETTCLMRSYTLPDGQRIRLGEERFMVPEALLNPLLIHTEGRGLADMIHDSVKVINTYDMQAILTL
jgi:actin-related protein 2